jgi:hypothetical protein
LPIGALEFRGREAFGEVERLGEGTIDCTASDAHGNRNRRGHAFCLREDALRHIDVA